MIVSLAWQIYPKISPKLLLLPYLCLCRICHLSNEFPDTLFKLASSDSLLLPDYVCQLFLFVINIALGDGMDYILRGYKHSVDWVMSGLYSIMWMRVT